MTAGWLYGDDAVHLILVVAMHCISVQYLPYFVCLDDRWHGVLILIAQYDDLLLLDGLRQPDNSQCALCP